MMQLKTLITLLLTISLTWPAALLALPEDGKENGADAPKYHFEFNLKGSEDSLVYMANYYGHKQYYFDTLYNVGNGKFVYEGDSLNGGIYMIVMPDRAGYFEVMVTGDEETIIMSTDRNDLIASMQVKESDENRLFYEFQNSLGKMTLSAGPMHQRLEELRKGENNEDSIKILEEKLNKLNDEVIAYKRTFIEGNANSFAAKVFKASQEPEIPDAPELPEGVEANDWKYYYFREHFWDNIDLTDDRMVRTPVLAKKLEYYITKLTPQMPDSIAKMADILIEKARPGRENFKYIVHWITNHYERSKIMGMDAVFTHMGLTYYCTGQAFWVDSATATKICERAKTLEPLLIGKVASNIILPDTAGKWHNMNEIPADFTVMVFWSSTCGHCKKEIPRIEEFHEKYKDKGVVVYGIGTELEIDNFKKFIRTNNISFLNVSDTPEINKNAHDYMLQGLTTLNSLNFRTVYDIFSTPQIYILDKDKKIIAKKLGADQLGDFIDNYNKPAKGAGAP